MATKYWVKMNHGPWEEVDPETFVYIEEQCGFFNRSGSGPSTSGFMGIVPSGYGKIIGRVTNGEKPRDFLIKKKEALGAN